MRQRRDSKSDNWRGEGFLINAAYWSGVIPLALLVVIPSAFWPLIEHVIRGVPETIGEALIKQVAWLVVALVAMGLIIIGFAVAWSLWKILGWLIGLVIK